MLPICPTSSRDSLIAACIDHYRDPFSLLLKIILQNCRRPFEELLDGLQFRVLYVPNNGVPQSGAPPRYNHYTYPLSYCGKRRIPALILYAVTLHNRSLIFLSRVFLILINPVITTIYAFMFKY